MRADPALVAELTPPEGDDGSEMARATVLVSQATAAVSMAGLDAALGDALRACDATVVLEWGRGRNAAFPMLRAACWYWPATRAWP